LCVFRGGAGRDTPARGAIMEPGCVAPESACPAAAVTRCGTGSTRPVKRFDIQLR
jgi:hypothetical protein